MREVLIIMDVNVGIKKGKDLPEEYIEFMNKARINEYGFNSKNFKKDELDSIFFYVKKDNEIKSFGMLKPITIKYLGNEFDILGIGAIMSIEKRKGYGRILINGRNIKLPEK